jgi:Capsule assembly protein Wzi
MKKHLIILLILLFVDQSNAQPPLEPRYEASVSAYLAAADGNRQSFWQYANEYNAVPYNQSVGLLGRVKIGAPFQQDSLPLYQQKFKFNYDFEGVFWTGKKTEATLIEGYAGISLAGFELWAGRKKETYGLIGDGLLTSGSYAWSGNAIPIPKIQLNTADYYNIPFTQGIVALKGSYCHGWLGDNRIQTVRVGDKGTTNINAYLHQKTLYGRLGKPSWPVQLYAGFNHQAVWGGDQQIWSNGLTVKQAYQGVIVGSSFGQSRIGNHVGSIDLGAVIYSKKYKITVYRQSMYDDGSLYYFLNIRDGLNGINIAQKNNIHNGHGFTWQSLAFEFLNTTDQAGSVFDWDLINSGAVLNPGRDNYFNHYIYLNGWSYKNKTVGTPFLPFRDEVGSRWPRNKDYMTSNNRVKVFHLAGRGGFNSWNWLAKLSVSSNWGTYDVPFTAQPAQFSGILQLSKPVGLLGGSELFGSLALDAGQL